GRWPVTAAGVILDLMSDVTRILSAIEHGDTSAAEQLLPLVYDELRQLASQKLAHEQPGQTLQATALVHEAYLRLVGGETPHRSAARPQARPPPPGEAPPPQAQRQARRPARPPRPGRDPDRRGRTAPRPPRPR